MKYHRITPGLYRSEDGRVEITKVTSQQTYRRTEVVWEIIIDGHALPRCEETKRDAIATAERKLRKGGNHESIP